MSTRRITVEEVLEAYRVTGLRPRPGYYFCGGSACAMGAIAIAAGAERSSLGACDYVEDHFNGDYHGGFTSGFDGREIHESASGEMKQGFTDGQAVAAAVFQKQGEQA